MAKNSMPWETGSSGKYQYHPGADANATPKDAPSAVNVVVVPNVNLPQVYTTLSEMLVSPRRHSRWQTRTDGGSAGEQGSYQAATKDAMLTHSLTGTAREVQQVGQGWILESLNCKEGVENHALDREALGAHVCK